MLEEKNGIYGNEGFQMKSKIKCPLLADDIVLISTTKQQLNTKLELWRKTLESNGLKITRTKTKYVECTWNVTLVV